MSHDCDVCWGSGYYHGVGAPCSRGCKPPSARFGLEAEASPDSAKEPIVFGVDYAAAEDYAARMLKTPEEMRDAFKAAYPTHPGFQRGGPVGPKAVVGDFTVETKSTGHWDLSHSKMGYILTAYISAHKGSPNISPFVRVDAVNQTYPWNTDMHVTVDTPTRERAEVEWLHKAQSFICNAINPTLAVGIGLDEATLTLLAQSLVRQCALQATGAGLFRSAPVGCDKSFECCRDRFNNDANFGGVYIPGPTPDTPCPFVFKDSHCGLK